MKLGMNVVRRILRPMGIAITKSDTLDGLISDRFELMRMNGFLTFLSALTPEAMVSALRMFPSSRGENFQDIFAMLVLEEHAKGFFVEFGATNGVTGSNSYMMEKIYGWSGILAEPARCWHEALQRNRGAMISHKCVWREGGVKLPFREARDAGFSTLDTLTTKDRHAARRVAADIYEVETTTLCQLLSENDAPMLINYLSIDTEGSELDILETLDFDRYRPLVLTVEHNYRSDREKIVALMRAQGYARAPTQVSAYDDWFVCSDLVQKLATIFVQEACENA